MRDQDHHLRLLAAIYLKNYIIDWKNEIGIAEYEGNTPRPFSADQQNYLKEHIIDAMNVTDSEDIRYLSMFYFLFLFPN